MIYYLCSMMSFSTVHYKVHVLYSAIQSRINSNKKTLIVALWSTPMEGESTLDAADLVVASQQVKLVWSEKFLREEVGDHLDAAGSAVYVVAK